MADTETPEDGTLIERATDALESKFVAARAAVTSQFPLSQSLEEARKKRINQTLQLDMPLQLKKYAFIGDHTRYGQELAAVQSRVNWRIAEIGLPTKDGGKIHFLNPDQLVYGTKALEHSCSKSGMGDKDCAHLAEDMRKDFTEAARNRQEYGEDFAPVYKSSLWPHSQPVDSSSTSTVVVPHMRGDDYNPFLNPLEAIQEMNYHEAWHSLHPDYDKEIEAKWNDPKIPQAEKDRLRIKQESVADLGAVSEMIQTGAGTDIIDKVRNMSMNGDLEHVSAFSLDAFKAKVETMGVDNFRQLGSRALHKMIIETVEESTPPPQQIDYMREQMQSKNPFAAPAGDAVTEEFRAKLQEMKQEKDAQIAAKLTRPPPVVDDMRKELLDRAFSLGKVITPASIMLAHQEMQFEMQMGSLYGSKKLNYAGSLSELESTFAKMAVTKPDSVDYTAENLSRGMKIDDIERAATASLDAKPVHRRGLSTPPLQM